MPAVDLGQAVDLSDSSATRFTFRARMTTVRKHAEDAQANLLSEKMVPSRWLPWLLCRFFLALAGFLILLILACPFLDDGHEIPSGGHRLLAIFCPGLAVRRRSMVSCSGR